ncbi:hypothetical protein SELSPUOL_02659 [Selenomonas sputigena ATCC 35185]|uniref:Uncharacterized protein n=1 Tax=Selenomonas sputigena (strain ATCC 35185 / DSM 20758 / CCUG 44933 / VPI D19B-28) TaxID=546271 RepID=C9LYU7_SELS3|nr:hypothetical protein SELSPUOL_02659 [Selenomonas sputigena ATCC 35185]
MPQGQKTPPQRLSKPLFQCANYTHKHPLRGHCAPPLMKVYQSVCALRA